MRPRRFGYQHAPCTYPLTGHLMIASKVPALSHWVPLLNFSFPSAPHRLLSSSSCACVLIVPSAVSWWGCGRHIPATMDKVPRDQRCTCGPPLEIDGKMYPPKPPGLFTDCSVS
ncbi:hypothetical protein M438DRAFT_211304 [Aureobasidium pullulans EXF-150]|uniref:Uncharacterized protein n=1 Tax=Aureobasidium pullulans EXF-150 TaxID=1043002 RepID=A0A074YBT1_AURPU|nr:uncharacterized protein M438DRAFT_211304 [Aureobasidium pullulans EXF-150]KEQ84316.1 hypothetical protein M438DRAFT_211304 [Aureobasidium pullulans EXF-150]